MPIIQSCCCWHSLRKGCYAAAAYTMAYFTVTIATMCHFIDVEQRYLSGAMKKPESESFLEPDKITPFTVGLNIALLACSLLGLISCILLIVGVYKDLKFFLLPWIFAMTLETLVEVVNFGYLIYLQTVIIVPYGNTTTDVYITNITEPEVRAQGNNMNENQIMYNDTRDAGQLNFNPIVSFLFTMDFFIISVNLYAMVCVISQLQEYFNGRGTAAFDNSDRLAAVQYTAAGQHTTTTSSAPSGRRRSTPRPMPSRCDPEEFSEAPTRVMPSSLSKSSRSAVKKHVKFPDESCIEEATEIPDNETQRNSPVLSSLWMELETETHVPER